MVNYSLEEFKEWLAEKPEKKKGITELNLLTRHIARNPNDIEKVFKKENIPNVAHFATGSGWEPYRQIFLKWKAEVDQRERERERERANSGGRG